jgi:phosphatidate cytidylyltransferase
MSDWSFYERVVVVLTCLAGLLLMTSVYLHFQRNTVVSESRQALHLNVRARVRSWWWILGAVGMCAPIGRWGILLLFFLVSLQALKEFVSVMPTKRQDYPALVLLFYVVLPLHYVLIALHQSLLAFALTPLLAALCLGLTGRHVYNTWRFLGVLICVLSLSALPAYVGEQTGAAREMRLLTVGFILLIVQVSDVAQFICGKALGRHALAPRWSPAKTWEGVAGGLLSAGLLGAASHWLTPFPVAQAVFLALVLSTLGVLGGLLMSAIKRRFGVKDWGGLLAGHGGVLDRVDSLILSAPALTAYLHWVNI